MTGCENSAYLRTAEVRQYYGLVLLCFQPCTYHVGTRNSCYLRTYFLLVPHNLSKPKVLNTVILLVYHVSEMFGMKHYWTDGTKKRWSRVVKRRLTYAKYLRKHTRIVSYRNVFVF
jgi:hypothetical protein